jgi:hypothetical protein
MEGLLARLAEELGIQHVLKEDMALRSSRNARAWIIISEFQRAYWQAEAAKWKERASPDWEEKEGQGLLDGAIRSLKAARKGRRRFNKAYPNANYDWLADAHTVSSLRDATGRTDPTIRSYLRKSQAQKQRVVLPDGSHSYPARIGLRVLESWLDTMSAEAAKKRAARIWDSAQLRPPHAEMGKLRRILGRHTDLIATPYLSALSDTKPNYQLLGSPDSERLSNP